jgi:hypothetical protein
MAAMTHAAPGAPVTIRTYRPGDREALHEICVRTGHLGGDATGHLRDPAILPAIFAAPYAALDPGLVFVADDGERAIGYLVGTADSTAYYAAFRARWLPTVADRFPAPAVPPRDGDEDEDANLRDLLHHADGCCFPRSPRATRPTCTSTCCRTARAAGSAAA